MIELLDHMGDDLAVVNAARVSMHKESHKVCADDEKLIRYLATHNHWTPFAHVQFQFRIKMPIFVAREWFRSTVGFCVAGDTKVTFDVPSNSKHKQGKKTKTIEELWSDWEYGRPPPMLASEDKIEKVKELIAQGMSQRKSCKIVGISQPTFIRHREGRIRYLNRKGVIKNRRLRVLNENTGFFEVGHIEDITQQGVQPVFKVYLADGKTVTMTKNHRVFTKNGWSPLEEAVGLVITKEGVVVFDKGAALAVNGVPVAGNGLYRDKDWLKNMKDSGCSVSDIADASGASYHTIRKWLKIYSLQYDQLKNLAGVNGIPPWNKGKTGYKVNRDFTEEERRKISERQKGDKSNFWRGGITPERRIIGAWATLHAKEIHERFDYTCQKCGSNKDLRCHHIIPVAVDPSKGMDMNNLITVCDDCHKKIHKSPESEMDFAMMIMNGELLPVSEKKWKDGHRSSKMGKNKLHVHYVEVTKIEYAGEQMTYDISVQGPWHNFLANGVVVHNSRNEVSRRYVDTPPEFWTPKGAWRGRAENVKQGSGELLPEEVCDDATRLYWEAVDVCSENYRAMLDIGVCPEQARTLLPQSMLTEFVETGSLAAYARIYNLRSDPHAQVEIQDYAHAISEAIAPIVPVSWAALTSS